MPWWSRTLTAWVALVAGMLLLGGCARYESGIGTATIANTVVRYYRAIENNDCAAIKVELIPEWASSVDCDQLVKQWDGLSGADVSYPERTTRIKDDVATVVASVRRQPDQPGCTGGTSGDSTVTHQLLVANGAWRIANIYVDCK